MNDQIPNGWEYKRLEDIVEKITSGGTPKVGNLDYYGGGVPFLKIDDLTRCNGFVVKSSKESITEKAIAETSAKLFPTGTVVTTMYGTIGTTKILGKPMATNQAIAAFLGLKSTTPEFLSQILKYSTDKLISLSGQTTQANISAGTLKNFEIYLPPAPEQKKIAAILTSVDDVIENTQAQIAKLEDLKRATMNELLTNGIGHMEFKETEIGRIPKSWAIKKIKEISINLDSKRVPIKSEDRKKIKGKNNSKHHTEQSQTGKLRLQKLPPKPIKSFQHSWRRSF